MIFRLSLVTMALACSLGTRGGSPQVPGDDESPDIDLLIGARAHLREKLRLLAAFECVYTDVPLGKVPYFRAGLTGGDDHENENETEDAPGRIVSLYRP